MKTKVVNVYEFSELSEQAKRYAIQKWYETEDYPFLEDYLNEMISELAAKHEVEIDDIKILYDLSYCQGSGLCFTGEIEKDDIKLVLSHSYRYYFATSVTMEYFKDGEEVDEVEELKDIYLSICRELKEYGYSILEYRMNNIEFQELCDANGYMFLENGELD